MTEPISDEALALLREEHSGFVAAVRSTDARRVVAALPGGDLCAADDYYVPCPTLALLARLDAAEADRDHLRYSLAEAEDLVEGLRADVAASDADVQRARFLSAERGERANALILKAEAERDAALARAVPDGWEVSWVAESPIGPVNVPRLVPADTEPGEPT